MIKIGKIYHENTETRSKDCLKSGFGERQNRFQATTCYWRMKGAFFITGNRLIKSPVFLQQQTGFVKFMSGTAGSNLTKSPLVFHAAGRPARSATPSVVGGSAYICAKWH